MVHASTTDAEAWPALPAQRTVEHVASPPPPPMSLGGQAGFEEFKARVYQEPALKDEVIPADFWLMKFYDGYQEGAMAALIQTVQWRNEFRYYELKDEGDKFANDVASGKLVYCKDHKKDSPALLWRVALHVADATRIEHTVRFIIWQVERGIRLGIIKDRVTFFLDRTGSSTQHVESIPFFRLLISTLQTHFPELLQRMVLFPSNFLLQASWKVVKPFLDVTVVQKVEMFGPKEYTAGMLMLVDEKQLLDEHERNAPEPGADKDVDAEEEPSAKSEDENVYATDVADVSLACYMPEEPATAVSVPPAEVEVSAAPPPFDSLSAHDSACDIAASSPPTARKPARLTKSDTEVSAAPTSSDCAHDSACDAAVSSPPSARESARVPKSNTADKLKSLWRKRVGAK